MEVVTEHYNHNTEVTEVCDVTGPTITFYRDCEVVFGLRYDEPAPPGVTKAISL